MNLFIGVIFSNYKTTEKQKKHPFLTDVQVHWIELHQFILNAEPYLLNIPKKGLKKFLYNLLYSQAFSLSMIITLLINAIILSTYIEDETLNYKFEISNINILISVIYIFETFLKIFIYGIKGYLVLPSHKFEFLICLCNSASSVIFFNKNIFKNNIKMKKFFGVLKIISIFRLMTFSKSLVTFFSTLLLSVPLLFYMFVFFISINFTYSIFGCYLFKDVKKGIIIDEYVNFKNFLYGMGTLFRCATGEDWTKIMYDNSKYFPNCTKNIDCGSSK